MKAEELRPETLRAPDGDGLSCPTGIEPPCVSTKGFNPARDEWCRRFVTHMIERAAPRDHFDDGELILDYAEATAPTYWDEPWQRDMGPEESADADISYWGEE